MSYINNLEDVNTLAGSAGEPYTRQTGIPQGDPISMMVIALLSTAWMNQMEELGVQPRILADDIAVLAGGENAPEAFEKAYDATQDHLTRMGARISPQKCIVFASSDAHRWLL